MKKIESASGNQIPQELNSSSNFLHLQINYKNADQVSSQNSQKQKSNQNIKTEQEDDNKSGKIKGQVSFRSDKSPEQNKISTPINVKKNENQQKFSRKQKKKHLSMYFQDKPMTLEDRIKIPPNWDQALQHSMARKVSKEREEEDLSDDSKKVCACCGYEVYRDELPMCTDTSELNFLGSAYALLFTFTKFCILILAGISLIIGIPFMYMNYHGSYCWRTLADLKSYNLDKQSLLSTCFGDSITQITMLNSINDENIQRKQEYLMIVATIYLMVILIFIRRHQKKIETELDSNFTSPGDYSVYVKGAKIEKNQDYESELKDYFGKLNVTVKKIVPVYQLSLYHKAQKELQEVVIEKQEFIGNQKFKEFPTPQMISEHLKYDKKINICVNNLLISQIQTQKDTKFLTGNFFISFNLEKERNDVLQLNEGRLEKLKMLIGGSEGVYDHHKLLIFHGHHLQVIPASEPNDYIWEDLMLSHKEKLKHRVLGFLCWVFVLIIAFIVLLFLKFLQIEIMLFFQSQKGQVGFEIFLFFESMLQYMIPFCIIFFQKVYTPQIKKIIKYEKWGTITKKMVSYAWKYAFGGMILQIILLLVICGPIFHDIIGPGGFLYLCERIMFIKPIIKNAWKYIDPMFQKKLNRQEKEQRKNFSTLTQQQANEIMEYPNYNLSKPYSEVLNIIMQSLFLVPLIPVVIFYSMIGLIIFYWIEKHVLLKKRSAINSISYRLTVEMIEMLESSILVFTSSNFFFRYHFSGYFSKISIVLFVVGLIYSILPMEYLTNFYYSRQTDEPEIKNYEQAEYFFDTDYDRENPILKEDAIKRVVQQRFDHRNMFFEKFSKNNQDFGNNNDFPKNSIVN